MAAAVAEYLIFFRQHPIFFNEMIDIPERNRFSGISPKFSI